MNSKAWQICTIQGVVSVRHPWSQFVAMTMAQLSGRTSLRDIVANMSAQAHRLYHLGSARLSCSNLSRINENKPYSLYEALFGKLLSRCQAMAPRHGFRFQNKRYAFTCYWPLSSSNRSWIRACSKSCNGCRSTCLNNVASTSCFGVIHPSINGSTQINSLSYES